VTVYPTQSDPIFYQFKVWHHFLCREEIVQARRKIAKHLVRQIGISMAEAARQLGVSTPEIFKMIIK